MQQQRIKPLVLALASIGFASLPWHALANPEGGQVVAGKVTIQQENAHKIGIRQTSDKAIIDWQKFNIGANEHVQYYQPSAKAVALNRVVGQDPSAILGRLTANGQVFLVNPNGVYFGKNAQIDVAGLVASTHNIRNEDFLAGNYRFDIPGKPGAAVINEGVIRIADTGVAAFVAPSVANRGVVVARLGKVALAAANGFTLDFHGDELLAFLVGDEVAQTAFDLEGRQLTSFVDNAGRIEAAGGYVLLTARAAENAIHGVINHSGVIEARTIGQQNGEIILHAGKGSLEVSGTLDASAPDGGNGGFIETSGGKVGLGETARITTAAPFGKTGQWLIDPTDYVISAAGGNITGAALAGFLASNNVEIQTLTTGGGNGDIIVNDSVTWGTSNKLMLTAYRHIDINAAIDASGGGSVKLRADSTGSGTGTVHFSGSGRIAASGNATVGIYYNPSSYADQTTRSATTGNPYSSKVTLSGNATLTPYMLVNDVYDLQDMQTRLNGYYALGKDIDASVTTNWNSGAGFAPIGNSTQTFSGTLFGDGHIISKLFISRSNNEVGLFGAIGSNGKVKNIGLTDANITGTGTAGILAGTNHGNIFQAFATGQVTGNTAGGLVGQNTGSGIIRQSFATGTVNGLDGGSAGGLAGTNSGAIRDAFTTSAVKIAYLPCGDMCTLGAAGALVGNHLGGEILDAYATGLLDITGSLSPGYNGLFGGFGFGTTTNSYWNVETTGQSNSPGGTGKTTAQMKQRASYSGWDFSGIWRIDEGSTYPWLAWVDSATADAKTLLKPSGNTATAGSSVGQSTREVADICSIAPIVCRPESAPLPPVERVVDPYIPSEDDSLKEFSYWSAIKTLGEDMASGFSGMAEGYAEGIVSAAHGVIYLAGQVSACSGGMAGADCTIDTEWGAARQDIEYLHDNRHAIYDILRNDHFQNLIKALFSEIKQYIQKNRAYDEVGKVGGRILMTVLSMGVGSATNVLNGLDGYEGLKPKISPILSQMQPFLAALPPR